MKLDTDSIVDRIMSMYERSPILRMVVASYPTLKVTEAGILAIYNWWRHRRMYVFADEIMSLNLEPTQQEVESREICEAFGATARRVLDTAREDKIRLFARLFASFVREGRFTPESFDNFEEDLSILDELGYREFQLLLVLRKYELQFPLQEGVNQAQRTAKYWSTFKTEAVKTLNIPEEDIDAALQRLTRTGLYQIITGTYWDYAGDRGHLSPNFPRLLKRVGMG